MQIKFRMKDFTLGHLLREFNCTKIPLVLPIAIGTILVITQCVTFEVREKNKLTFLTYF